jgi:predicted nucleic acid-binding protein
MKRKDATQPVEIPSAEDEIPELTAWLRAQDEPLSTREQPHFAAELPTLYLDTTIVSQLVGWLSRDASLLRQQKITRHWWRQHSHRHARYTSDVVITEALKGELKLALQRWEILRPLSRVHPSEQTHELAARILAECRLPEREYKDAHHAALAAIHKVKVLLTWNCKHLANQHMIPHIGRACEAYGYAPPVILTPEQLIGVCAYG